MRQRGVHFRGASARYASSTGLVMTSCVWRNLVRNGTDYDSQGKGLSGTGFLRRLSGMMIITASNHFTSFVAAVVAPRS